MNLKDKMIIDEYRTERGDFLRLETIVAGILHDIIKELHVEILAVEHRVKAEDSLIGKLYRHGDWYNSIDDLTDILGARVICFFSDDVDRVGKEVEKRFKIDWENSSDKRALIKADSFGYLSLHYICSLKDDGTYPAEICKKRFEIQIRTGLQHIWAAINHDIGYKSKFGVPREITREFSRLAGLLEIADDEFVRVRDDMGYYVDDIHEKIVSDRAQEVAINLVSLKEYMLYNKKMREFLDSLAAIEGSEITDIDPESYIEQLTFLGKTTVGSLTDMLAQNGELAFILASRVLKGTELDILSSNIALRFLCRAELLIKNYTLDKAVEFINISVGDIIKAEKQAKRLLEIYENMKESK